MILEFLFDHWLDIILGFIGFLLILVPFFPPQFAGLNKEYFDLNEKKLKKQRNFNFVELIPMLFTHTLLQGPILSIGFRGTVTLILFIVLGADLYLNRRITDNGVTLSIIGIIALYLEKIIDGAEEITIWKVFSWKSKKP